MKKLIFSLVAFATLAVSTNVFAGAMKEIVIEAEDMIYSEFYNAGDRQVISITDHKFVKVSADLGLQAKVVTRNIYSKMTQEWTCVVSFDRDGNSYSARDVDCR